MRTELFSGISEQAKNGGKVELQFNDAYFEFMAADLEACEGEPGFPIMLDSYTGLATGLVYDEDTTTGIYWMIPLSSRVDKFQKIKDLILWIMFFISTLKLITKKELKQMTIYE